MIPSNEYNWPELFTQASYLVRDHIFTTEKPQFPVPYVIPDPSKPPLPNHTRFVCVADTHAGMNMVDGGIPFGDVFLHCGDYGWWSTKEETSRFVQCLKELPHKHKIFVPGNHDAIFHGQEFYDDMAPDNWRQNIDVEKEISKLRNVVTILDNEVIEISGFRILGMTWPDSRPTSSPPSPPFDEPLLNHGPVDIVLSHQPPAGILDLDHTSYHCGSIPLFYKCSQEWKPLVHVFGHIHSQHGALYNGKTLFLNVSTTFQLDIPKFAATVFDLPNKL